VRRKGVLHRGVARAAMPAAGKPDALMGVLGGRQNSFGSGSFLQWQFLRRYLQAGAVFASGSIREGSTIPQTRHPIFHSGLLNLAKKLAVSLSDFVQGRAIRTFMRKGAFRVSG
jgi:hypothetical protein